MLDQNTAILFILISTFGTVLCAPEAAKETKKWTVDSVPSESWDSFSLNVESYVNTSNSPYLHALDVFFRRLSISNRFQENLWERLPERWASNETHIPVPDFNFKNLSAAADMGALRSSGDTYFTESHLHDSSAPYFTINETVARSGRTLTSADLDRHLDAEATLSINKAGMVWPWIGEEPRCVLLEC